tara:strand:- start:145 stop:792 length:648 start_codon:yes stop_codon:yes gene_type:complete
MEKQEYFLTSRHGNLDSTVVFHNANEQGYGTDLNKLNVYSKEQAQKQHNNYGRDSLPILVSKAMEKCTERVDVQYIDLSKGLYINKPNYKVVVQIVGRYDGNDIQFKTKGGRSYDLTNDCIFELSELDNLGCGVAIWCYEYIKSKTRKTLQQKNINIRSMCRGVKLQRKRKCSDSGLVRWNCPTCGKLSWQYSPYDFDGCKDLNCKSHNAYMSSY